MLSFIFKVFYTFIFVIINLIWIHGGELKFT